MSCLEIESHSAQPPSSSAVNELIDFSYEIPKDCIDCATVSFNLKNELVNSRPQQATHQINIDKTNLKMLIKELKTARDILAEYD